jgi:DNA modification methylase
LSYTAIHIWDKVTGASDDYERIFERNGQRRYRVFNFGKVNSSVSAQFTRDVWTGHKSQKPIKLLRRLITDFIPKGSVIFDPFSGSGSTLAAARDLGYEAVGCEVSAHWCGVTVERLAQQSLFTLPNNRLHSDAGESPRQQAFFTPEADSAEGKLPTPTPRR